MYSSVELGPSSGLVGYDDLHKTQYSTLQQEAQEESSFNEGKEFMCIIGSVYNETVRHVNLCKCFIVESIIYAESTCASAVLIITIYYM